MNRFLLGALAMGAVFVLTSFALTRSPSPAGGPAWTVSQYQIDRAFRTQLQLAGPLTSQMPATGGLIITEVRASNASMNLTITVNGVGETFNLGNTGGAPFGYSLNPPIVARPNDVLSINANGSGAIFAIAGYTTLPGET